MLCISMLPLVAFSQHLPGPLCALQAGQGGQVEADGMVSGRAAERAALEEGQGETPPEAKKPSRRRLQRGNAAVEGDGLTKAMLEQTMKTDEEGNRYIDRASFGEGKVQWYSIGVSATDDCQMQRCTLRCTGRNLQGTG